MVPGIPMDVKLPIIVPGEVTPATGIPAMETTSAFEYPELPSRSLTEFFSQISSGQSVKSRSSSGGAGFFCFRMVVPGEVYNNID